MPSEGMLKHHYVFIFNVKFHIRWMIFKAAALSQITSILSVRHVDNVLDFVFILIC